MDVCFRFEAESLMKKFKDRAFAAGVDREDVADSAEKLGVDLKEHIQSVIEAMREIADELGLGNSETADGVDDMGSP